jgi:hypothetical protein
MKQSFDQFDRVLKWTATVVLIAGALVNSLGYYPLGPIMLTVGGAIWLWVSIRWREPSMIVTNTAMVVAGVSGLVYNLV